MISRFAPVATDDMLNAINQTKKLPPHSAPAECGLLSCILAQPELLREITLLERDFFDLRHATIYSACRQLKQFDFITLQEYLRTEKTLPQIGGVEYLSRIQDAAPSPANWEYYRDIVAEKSELRKIIATCSDVVAKIYDYEGDIADLKFQVQSDLGEVFGTNKNEIPRIVTARDFNAKDIPEPAQIIHGVLHAGSKMAVGGASKSFKTWTLLDIALSVSTGRDWLDFHTTQSKVLYLNFEIQNYSWRNRLKIISHSKEAELNDNFQLWNLRGYITDFRNLIPKIITRCTAENYGLIVLDPIYKIYGNTDENSARDTAALLNALEDLANQTGAAIAFGAHFAKGNAAGKNAIDRISGSGVFARDPDAILVFTEHEADGAFTIEPILRNFPRIPPFTVRWNFPLMTPVTDLDPACLKQSKAGRKPEKTNKELLALIVANDELNPISVTDWSSLAGIPRKTLSSRLAEMRSKNWIKTVGEGTSSKQTITNDGNAFVNS